jgi:hypothetical protein
MRALIVLTLALLVTSPGLLQAQTADANRLLEKLLRPDEPVGRLSTNPYLPRSTSTPYARFDPTSPANPYGRYGSAYSTDGARNPYTTGGLKVYGSDGTYLGRLNSNRYDPESVSNPYGRYGSPYSPTSINNPYGTYGSAYSPRSAANPHAPMPPVLVKPREPLGMPSLLPPIGGRR